MKKLAIDDLDVGQAVTILHGPYEKIIMPPMMLGGEEPPSVDTAVPGRVFMVEALDLNTGLIMLKAMDGGGPPTQKIQQAGPLMALFPEQHAPDTFMFRLDSVELAAVSPDWLKAYARNFCAHKRGMNVSRTRITRKAGTPVDDKVADTKGLKGPSRPSE